MQLPGCTGCTWYVSPARDRAVRRGRQPTVGSHPDSAVLTDERTAAPHCGNAGFVTPGFDYVFKTRPTTG